MSSPTQSNPSIDLTTCDREPIHFAGHVQPFGCLVSISADWIVNHASQNVSTFFGPRAEDMLGRPLKEFVTGDAIRRIQAELKVAPDTDKVDRHFNVAAAIDRDEHFDIAVFATATGVVIEFELHESADTRDYVLQVRPMVGRIGHAANLTDLCALAAPEVQALTGFDRVMIYRFLADDTGEVVAEAAREDLEPYLGLRYPASDIPRQARALYQRNLLRIISDVNARPSPITPELSATGDPLDLSLSGLRAVSPVHLQYLRNMGVGASMSISIIVRGKLWGLIACHHMSPRVLNYRVRSAAELFGQMIGFLIDQQLSNEERVQFQNSARMHDTLMSRLAADQSILENFGLIADVTGEGISFDGIGVWVDGAFQTRGLVPAEEHMPDFIRFINTAAASKLFYTDRLGALYPAASQFPDDVAGVLALPVSRTPRDYILLFRREILKSVTWAGNPDKPVTVQDGTWRLTPRKSFEAWQELVKGQSAEWSASELQLAESLRVSLLEVVLRMSDAANKDMQEARKRQEVLIGELNHRVRNILSLIRSLIARTGKETQSVAEFTDIVGGRIHALATAHDLITSVDWQAASILGLIEKETQVYSDADNPRLVVEGNDALVEPQAFTTLALVLHELTTNSVKYGALSASEGKITIRLSHSEGRPLVLEWEESGGPEVRQPTRRGFGTTIIENSIPFDLKGKTDVAFLPEGLRVRIEVPGGYVAGTPQRITESKPSKDLPDKAKTREDKPALLSGTVLLLEDNMIIALDAEDMLPDLGASLVVTATSVSEAIDAVEETPLSFALLDVNLGRETSGPVAQALTDKGIPFAFATGYGERSDVASAFPAVPIVLKPYNEATLRSGIEEVSGAAGKP